MHDNTVLVEARIDRFVRDRITPAVYRRAVPLTITAWEAPGEPVPFAEAVLQTFEPFAVGSPWSRPWGTTWFHVTGTVPDDLGTDPATALELVVDLGFSIRQPGFQAEGLVWRPDGTIVKAIEPYNGYVPLTAIGAGVTPGSTIDVYVEAASNPDIGGDDFHGETPLGDPETAGDAPIYALRQHRARRTRRGGRRTRPRRLDPRRADAHPRAHVAATARDPAGARPDVRRRRPRGRRGDRGSRACRARRRARGTGERERAPGRRDRPRAHRLGLALARPRDPAQGRPHLLERRRPDGRRPRTSLFAASSAQQYAWLKERYPELFARVAQKVAEGRFVPVGGMWVESDTNMPGGEALAPSVRRGQGVLPARVRRRRRRGLAARLVRLHGRDAPDRPRRPGPSSFFTQKESWNETNRMPHHTFLWEGIDGSRVFTHFPARRHVQLRPLAGRARPRRERLRREGVLERLDRPVRLG